MPVVPYTDKLKAIGRSEELSEKNPGLEFFVMEATHYTLTKNKVTKAEPI